MGSCNIYFMLNSALIGSVMSSYLNFAAAESSKSSACINIRLLYKIFLASFLSIGA